MALSGSQVTRLGIEGGPRANYGSFEDKTEQTFTGPPKFRGFLRNVGRLKK